ncbi:hypothetical protein MA16_Dca009386 [Dendrobium catenatum]|uniref:Uncharacterized protein n=1 Tax=Dendrobium catenatum TaxID=906689 RepID=A0A2I0XH57_9ASPA|nr:hypothetical protein MA16_Dca009386 [Dendrobium catenatum]
MSQLPIREEKGTSSKERSRTRMKEPKKPLVQSYTSCEAMKPNSNDDPKDFIERFYNPLNMSGFLFRKKHFPYPRRF